MYKRLMGYFSDAGDTEPSYVRLTQSILVFSIIATFVSIWIVSIDSDMPGFLFVIITLLFSGIFEIVALVFARWANILPVKIALPWVLTIAVTAIAATDDDLHNIAMIAYPLVIVIGNLLQGRRSLWVTTPFVLAAIMLLGAADMRDLTFASSNQRVVVNTVMGVFLVWACARMLYFLIERLQIATLNVEANEQARLQAVEQLSALQESFDRDVARRTSEIDVANQRNEKRARQFEAIADVARAITVNQNLESLLFILTELISKQFDFYHVGIFLVDEDRQFAVLRAANSEGGRRMLAREHKLQLGQRGIVGYTSASGKARIALDTQADASFSENPDLPETRSEMALPLRVIDQVIGVLDIQSVVPNAFTEEDVDVLSTLADQVTIAIQNARSYEITQTLLAQAQQSSGEFLRESWRVLQSQQNQKIGYQVFDDQLQALSRPIVSRYAQTAISGRRTVKQNGDDAALAVPIRIRGEVVGVMDIRVATAHEWDDDELDIAEAIAERLSLALESSLLLKAAQRRAEIERVTADISGKIGASTQFDVILRTAAEELSRVLGGSDVLVQLNRDTFDT